MDERKLKQLINESPEWAVGALIAIYNQQTRDEQNDSSTKYDNMMGFNALDAEFLSSISECYKRRGYLSSGQLYYVKKSIIKYIKQLLVVGVTPLPFKTEEFRKKEAEENKKIPVVKKADLENGNTIVIRFSFPRGDTRFRTCLEQVKTIPMRKFNEDRKIWTVPLNEQNVKQLMKWEFTVGEELNSWYMNECSEKDLTKFLPMVESADFKVIPRPYQKEGVAFIESRKGRGLIADVPGLGKTLQALLWTHLHPELRPVYVVCPASVKLNWLREIKKCIPHEFEKANIISGRDKNHFSRNGINIINYDILKNHVSSIIHTDPKIIIADEIHFVGNRGTKKKPVQRTQAFVKLAKRTDCLIGLSGTPIKNRTKDFYTILNVLRPDIFYSYKKYAEDYCGRHLTSFMKKGGGGKQGSAWNDTGCSNLKSLNSLLTDTCMIRRLKKDVLKDLPDKIKTIVPLELTNRTEYDYAEEHIIKWIKETEGTSAAAKAKRAMGLVKWEKLKQLTLEGKKEAAFQWISDFLESGEKLVVFCWHTNLVDEITNKFSDVAVKLYGSTSLNKREEVKNRFIINDKIRLFVGNIKAAGTGIDGLQTVCSNCAILELPWTPADLEQAIDRLHRIGQDNSVTAWLLLADNSADIDIAEMLDEKQLILDQILDGKDTEQHNLILSLIHKMKKRRGVI